MTVNCTWSRAIRAGDEDGSRAIAAGCETREISTDRRRRDGAGSLLSGSTETVHAADGADGWENMGASLTQTATLRTPFCDEASWFECAWPGQGLPEEQSAPFFGL